MSKALKHYKEKVERILEKYEDSRNDDLVLLARYLSVFRQSLIHRDSSNRAYVYLDEMNARKMPPSQTLANNRKVIQNEEGKYLPTDEKVRKARRIKEENIRNAEWRETKAEIVKPAVEYCEHKLPRYAMCPDCERKKPQGITDTQANPYYPH